MRHQPQHIAAAIDYPRDPSRRAVWVGAIAEHHLALALQAVQGVFVGEEIALAIAHRHHRLAPVAKGGGEAGLAVDDVEVDELADIFQRGVA